jgi:hypothetical protein
MSLLLTSLPCFIGFSRRNTLFKSCHDAIPYIDLAAPGRRSDLIAIRSRRGLFKSVVCPFCPSNCSRITASGMPCRPAPTPCSLSRFSPSCFHKISRGPSTSGPLSPSTSSSLVDFHLPHYTSVRLGSPSGSRPLAAASNHSNFSLSAATVCTSAVQDRLLSAVFPPKFPLPARPPFLCLLWTLADRPALGGPAIPANLRAQVAHPLGKVVVINKISTARSEIMELPFFFL